MDKGKKTYKYQIVSEQRQPFGHMLYLIRYIAKNGAKSEQWIGQSKLKRFYEQDRLDGTLSSHVKSVVTAELHKSQGRTRGKVKLTPRDGSDKPLGFRLPNEWNAPKVEAEAQPELETKPKSKINIKAYCYSDDKGRWHVIQCDGTEDEDTYPDKEWAQRVADSLNNSLK